MYTLQLRSPKIVLKSSLSVYEDAKNIWKWSYNSAALNKPLGLNESNPTTQESGKLFIKWPQNPDPS